MATIVCSIGYLFPRHKIVGDSASGMHFGHLVTLTVAVRSDILFYLFISRVYDTQQPVMMHLENSMPVMSGKKALVSGKTNHSWCPCHERLKKRFRQVL